MVDFFAWYNNRHHHVSLGLQTPADVYLGRAAAITAERQLALNTAYAENSHRFVHGPPRAASPPERVTINPIDSADITTADVILGARASEMEALAPTPKLSTAPIVHLPGIAKVRGADWDQAITI